MENNENLLTNELQVDGNIQNHLKETAGWARFLGIVGFIVSGLIALGALFAGTIISKLVQSSGSYYGSSAASAMTGFITVIYLIVAGIGFMISLFTFKFGTKTRQAFLINDQESLNAGLMNLKFIFRFYGVIMVLYLGLIVLGLLGSIIGGLAK